MAQRGVVGLYPTSYQDIEDLGNYLKQQAGVVQAFVESQIVDLKQTLVDSLSPLAKRGGNAVQLQQQVDLWLPKFATLNYVFLIKFLELIYGVCIGQQDRNTIHILSTLPGALCREDWQKRVLLSLDSTSSPSQGYHYTKRCWAYVEHWQHAKFKTADLIALVSYNNL